MIQNPALSDSDRVKRMELWSWSPMMGFAPSGDAEGVG
jgi:hypothetical protein